MAKSKWTKEFPKEPGRYWFYGWPYGDTHGSLSGELIKPELASIEIWKCANGVAVVRNGQFWYKTDNPIGLFVKADVPELPDLTKLIPKQKAKK